MCAPKVFEILNKDIIEYFIKKSGFATLIMKTVTEP